MFDFTFLLNEKATAVEKSNLIATSSIKTLLEKQEYEKAYLKFKEHFENSAEIDIFALLSVFAADLTSAANLNDLSAQLNNESAVLKKHSQDFSPTARFTDALQTGVKHYIDYFTTLFLPIFQSENRDGDVEFCASLEEFCQALASLSTIEDSPEVHKSIEKFKVNILGNFVFETEEEASSEEQAEAEKAAAKKQTGGYLDKFASKKWYLFVRKTSLLRIFIHNSRFFEAAIVYKDIQDELKNFDPKDYFPGLFFPLYQALAPNARKIHDFIENQSKTLEWHVAQQLYRSDPLRFLNELPALMANNLADDQFKSADITENTSHPGNALFENPEQFKKNSEVHFNSNANASEQEPQANSALAMTEEVENEEINSLISDIDNLLADAQ